MKTDALVVLWSRSRTVVREHDGGQGYAVDERKRGQRDAMDGRHAVDSNAMEDIMLTEMPWTDDTVDRQVMVDDGYHKGKTRQNMWTETIPWTDCRISWTVNIA